MNEVLATILSRRSIRRYTGKAVEAEIVQQLLQAAMAAPSAHNEQPWQFVVIRDKQKLEAIAGFHRYAAMLPQADQAILVCGDMKRIKVEGFWIQDCAAATENILLAAHALGLGGVWLGVYPHNDYIHELSRLLGLPGYIVPFAMIGLGWPEEEKKVSDRFDPARIHLDHWPASES